MFKISLKSKISRLTRFVMFGWLPQLLTIAFLVEATPLSWREVNLVVAEKLRHEYGNNDHFQGVVSRWLASTISKDDYPDVFEALVETWNSFYRVKCGSGRSYDSLGNVIKKGILEREPDTNVSFVAVPSKSLITPFDSSGLLDSVHIYNSDVDDLVDTLNWFVESQNTEEFEHGEIQTCRAEWIWDNCISYAKPQPVERDYNTLFEPVSSYIHIFSYNYN